MKTIQEMAREATGATGTLLTFALVGIKDLEAFAALVREDEREACAKNKKDAERYLYMRNNAQFQNRNGPGLYWYLPRFIDGNVRDEGQELDAALDAAIRARSNT